MKELAYFWIFIYIFVHWHKFWLKMMCKWFCKYKCNNMEVRISDPQFQVDSCVDILQTCCIWQHLSPLPPNIYMDTCSPEIVFLLQLTPCSTCWQAFCHCYFARLFSLKIFPCHYFKSFVKEPKEEQISIRRWRRGYRGRERKRQTNNCM